MKKYKFNSDSKEVYDAKGDVSFMISLEDNIDPNVVRNGLEKLTDNIGYGKYFWTGKSIVCMTDKDTYETMFNSELEHDENKKGELGYTTEGYRAMKKGSVPESLKREIKSVYLNVKRWITA